MTDMVLRGADRSDVLYEVCVALKIIKLAAHKYNSRGCEDAARYLQNVMSKLQPSPADAASRLLQELSLHNGDDSATFTRRELAELRSCVHALVQP